MKIDKDPATLVVSERGGGWPGDVGERDRHVLAVPQERDEELAALITRVTATLDGLSLRGVEVGRAYLVCNRRMDEVAVVARVMIAEAILTALGKAGGGRLVLVANPMSSPSLEPHVVGLVRALARDPRVEVAASFDSVASVPYGVLRRARLAQVLN